MMRSRLRYLFRSAGLTLLMALPVYAKAPIERITLSGPGLANPVETTDSQLLELSNPWFGKFADWSKSLPTGPVGAPVYDVILHSRLSKSELRPIYRFHYAPGQKGRLGQVYLPGKGEPEYKQNVSIILRVGHDGHWQSATAEWESRIKPLLGLL